MTIEKGDLFLFYYITCYLVIIIDVYFDIVTKQLKIRLFATPYTT